MSLAALVVVIVLGLPIVLAVHEAGHALTAVLVGGRAIAVRWRRFGAEVVADVDTARARVVFALGGPFANVLVGIALLCVGGACAAVGALSIAFALACLAPGRDSDGTLAWAHARRRE